MQNGIKFKKTKWKQVWSVCGCRCLCAVESRVFGAVGVAMPDTGLVMGRGRFLPA